MVALSIASEPLLFGVSTRLKPGLSNVRLNEIPKIAEVISEHGNFTVRLRARRFLEFNALFGESRVVAVEVIGLQEKPNAVPNLLPHRLALNVVARLGENHAGLTVIGRGHGQPPLATPQVHVVDDGKTHLVAKAREAFGISRNDNGKTA